MTYVVEPASSPSTGLMVAWIERGNYNRAYLDLPVLPEISGRTPANYGSSRGALREPDEKGCRTRVRDDALRLTDWHPDGTGQPHWPPGR